jgi:hypothetical protein
MIWQLKNVLAKPEKFCPHGKRITGFADCPRCTAEINALAVKRLAERKEQHGGRAA